MINLKICDVNEEFDTEDKVLDNLQRNMKQLNEIGKLNSQIRVLETLLTKSSTDYQEREKDLLKAISKLNRELKREQKKVESYKNNKELIYLKEIVAVRGLKILELNKKINDYEMGKL